MLSPDVIQRGAVQEIANARDLIATLGQEDLGVRTRFFGLTVVDVARHIAGVVTDVNLGRTEGLASPMAVAREIEEREGVGPAELVQELERGRLGAAKLLESIGDAVWVGPAPAGFDGTFAEAVQAVWEDLWLHCDDIRDALGLPPDEGEGLQASVWHVVGRLRAQDREPEKALLREAKTLELGWSGEPSIVISPRVFVLVATGRIDPAAHGLPANLSAGV